MTQTCKFYTSTGSQFCMIVSLPQWITIPLIYVVIKKTTDSQGNLISFNHLFLIKKLYMCKQCILTKKNKQRIIVADTSTQQYLYFFYHNLFHKSRDLPKVSSLQRLGSSPYRACLFCLVLLKLINNS